MLQPGQILRNQYRIERILGRGGMGGVYQATYVDHSASVAIKEMLIEFKDPDEQKAGVEMFLSEAKLLYSLSHPSLPRMYDFFEFEGKWFLVMDLIKGTNLDRYLDDNGPVDERQARYLAHELATVLSYMHGQRKPVIFRDLKPANIMLDNDGHIKLIDFGIAKLFHDKNGGRTNTLIRSAGTLGFAAPEQYGAGTDERSDIYSLGATLYCLLTGLVPPASPSLAVGLEEVKPLADLRADVSFGFRTLVENMMRLMPVDRPPSMRAVLAGLAELPSLEDAPDTSRSSSRPATIVPSASSAPTEIKQPTAKRPAQPSPATPVPTPAPTVVAQAAAAVPRVEVPMQSSILLLAGLPPAISSWRNAADEVRRPTLVAYTLQEAIDHLAMGPSGVLLQLTSEFNHAEVVSLAHRCLETGVPLFVVAEPDQVSSRLELTSMGCALFFSQPVEPRKVLEGIDSVIRTIRRAPPMVLAVDDDEITLTAMEGILDMHGLPFHGLSDTSAFWSTLESVRPDFLILDVEMPGASGLDICRMVRADPEWRRLPILILTAAVDADLIDTVYQAGADDFATKPIFGDQLVTRIRNRLNRMQTTSTPLVPA